MSIRKGKIDTEHLLRDYEDLKRKLGRQPTCLEYAKECHSITSVVHVLGRPGWRTLLGLVGAKPRIRTNKFTQESVKDCYGRLKEKLGRSPSVQEYSKHCCSNATLSKLFGGSGWSNLQKSVGDYQPTRRYRPRGPSKSSILGAFRRIRRQLGKTPKYAEFRRLSGFSLKNIRFRFGENAWQKIQEAAKARETAGRNLLTAEHLIQDFLDLQRALGRRPKISEYLSACHTPKVLDRAFGRPGWKNLIAAIGAEALPKNIISAEHLLDDYLEICRHLGKTPTFAQFRSRHHHTHKVFDRAFGKPGWGNLKKAAKKRSS